MCDIFDIKDIKYELSNEIFHKIAIFILSKCDEYCDSHNEIAFILNYYGEKALFNSFDYDELFLRITNHGAGKLIDWKFLFHTDMKEDERKEFTLNCLKCEQCRDLVTSLQSKEDFIANIKLAAINLKCDISFLFNVVQLNTRQDLHHIITNMALHAGLIVFGSTVTISASGINANDLDITSEPKKLRDFYYELRRFFVLLDEKLEYLPEIQNISFFKRHKCCYIKHNKFYLKIDIIPTKQFHAIEPDFEATSLILYEHINIPILRNLNILKHTNIEQVMNDVKNRILRPLPKKITTSSMLAIGIKVVNRLILKQMKGWNCPDGIPNYITKYISYSITRNELATYIDKINMFNLPYDIIKIITNYIDGCLDDFAGSMCDYIFRIKDNIPRIIFTECKSNEKTIAKDFMVVLPCCKRTQCFGCLLKYTPIIRYENDDNKIPIANFMCIKCKDEIGMI